MIILIDLSNLVLSQLLTDSVRLRVRLRVRLGE